MVREEHELSLTKDEYLNVLSKAQGNIISKDRYIIPCSDNLKIELDIFKGCFEGLIMAEVEFPDEAAAKKYTPPEYFSEEVTFDRRFGNSTMSMMSKEEISDFILWIHENNSCANHID